MKQISRNHAGKIEIADQRYVMDLNCDEEKQVKELISQREKKEKTEKATVGL